MSIVEVAISKSGASEALRLIGFAPLVALLAVFIGARMRALRTGAWLALAALAQQASLDLYQAGPVVGYTHYRVHGDPRVMWSALAVLAFQLAAVVSALRARALAPWRELGPARSVLALALCLLCAAKVSRPAELSAAEFLFAALVDLIALGNLALAAWALPDAFTARIDEFWRTKLGEWNAPPEPEARFDRWVIALALASGALSACLCLFVYDAHPHVPDEVVYLIHARYLAHGWLELPAPPVPRAFDIDLMMLDGARWYSPVNPGWPFVLAVGEVFGVPWLVDPLLGAASVILAYLFVREIASLGAARVSAILLALSPWFVFMNMSFMTHSLTLCCGLLAALGVVRARRTQRSAWAWLAGAGIGMVALIRPLEGLVLALALGVWSLGLGGKRLNFASLAGLVLGTILVAASVFPYNAHFTGSPTKFPINDYVDRVYGPGKNDLGFGPDKGLGWGLDAYPGHSPLEAALNAQINGFAIGEELFGWSAGSLIFVWWLLARGKFERRERAQLAFIVALILANSLYWFSGGPDFGARYWYLAIVPCILLAVAGWRSLENSFAPARVRFFAAASTALALATFVPWRAADKYADYRGMEPGVRELARAANFGRSLVIVRGPRFPDYESAAIFNPLDLEGDEPIYARDLTFDDDSAGARDEMARLREHYRDRPVWYVHRDRTNDGGFRWSATPDTELLR